jgi:hypothetical protein
MGWWLWCYLLEISGGRMVTGGRVFGIAFSPFIAKHCPKPPFYSRFFMHSAPMSMRVQGEGANEASFWVRLIYDNYMKLKDNVRAGKKVFNLTWEPGKEGLEHSIYGFSTMLSTEFVDKMNR